jgi:hypothetical protein
VGVVPWAPKGPERWKEGRAEGCPSSLGILGTNAWLSNVGTQPCRLPAEGKTVEMEGRSSFQSASRVTKTRESAQPRKPATSWLPFALYPSLTPVIQPPSRVTRNPVSHCNSASATLLPVPSSSSFYHRSAGTFPVSRKPPSLFIQISPSDELALAPHPSVPRHSGQNKLRTTRGLRLVHSPENVPPDRKATTHTHTPCQCTGNSARTPGTLNLTLGPLRGRISSQPPPANASPAPYPRPGIPRKRGTVC